MNHGFVWVSTVYHSVMIQKWVRNSKWLCIFTDDRNGDVDKVEVFFFSTLLWFSLPKPWVRTVKRLSFVNQMIRHLCQHSTILPDSVSIHVRSFTFMFFFFSSFFYYVLKRPTLRLYCLDWVSCVRLSLSVISVSATEVDGYSKTAGAWILSLNRNLYPVNNVAECAARCDGEIAFTCRCSTLFPLTFSTHTKEQHMTWILKCKHVFLYHLLNYFQFKCNLFHFATLGCDGSA